MRYLGSHRLPYNCSLLCFVLLELSRYHKCYALQQGSPKQQSNFVRRHISRPPITTPCLFGQDEQAQQLGGRAKTNAEKNDIHDDDPTTTVPDSFLPERRRTLKMCCFQAILAATTTTTTTTTMMMTTMTTSVHQQQPPVAWALSPSQAEEAYNSFAPTYNELDGGKASTALGIDQARSQLIQKARGHVLEIAVGTGLNLDRYVGSQIESLTLMDISDGMLLEAQKTLEANQLLRQSLPTTVKFIKGDATADLISLFGQHSFDTVIDTFSLCVMGNQGAQQCLQQVQQVVKPRNEGGQILLLENSKSSNPLLGLYQDATADFVASAGGKGCLYNQDVRKIIQSVPGLVITNEQLFAQGLFRSFECVLDS